MTGLMAADYGRVFLDGHDITGLPMYRRARLGLGYLPQEASIFRGLTVENNIRAVLEVSVPARNERELVLDELLAEFSITHLRRTPSLALSGGESAGASRSPAPSPRNRASFCWTSRYRGSTRLRWRRFATSSPTSRTAASACC